MSKEEKVFFPNLDGFRFLSFLIVFLLHGFAPVVNAHQGGGFIITTLRIALFQSGQLGVSFFFVLSGFLITYLILTEKRVFGKFDVKAFYVRRSLRIFPIYFALLIFVFFILPLFIEIKLPNPLYYFLFLSNFDLMNSTENVLGIVAITWSVAIEEQFYIFWALLFYFANLRVFKYVCFSIIIGSLIFRWSEAGNYTVLYQHTFSVISELAIGGLCAYFIIFNEKFKSFLENLSVWSILLGYLMVLPIFAFSRYFYIYMTLGRLVLCLAIAFIILEQNFSKNSFYKMGNFKILSILGKYTYGLYLLHPLVIFFMHLLNERWLGWNAEELLAGSALGIMSLITSIIVCYLSFTYFESFFLSLKKHFVRVKTGETAT
ncbi:MAG TPA: acyltransferase [Pyrinomonadaceae bacterium]|nr:acyltransferase [Pyrinomonadaceae bacterium]